jgi:NAD(P)-dependent dehydrogenase (short-subunit alcohol dehydrogenase family)
MTHFKGQRILIIGGSSGIGFAAARRLRDAGAHVIVAGRTPAKLAAAATRLGDHDVSTALADIGDEASVASLLADVPPLDHVIVTAVDGSNAYMPLSDMDIPTAQRVLATKVLGPLILAKHATPRLPTHGTLTFTAGFNSHRPAPGGAAIAASNGALEALTRALSLELAPVRVNAVSPGWVDTEIWDAIAGTTKHERHAAMSDRLPIGRIGTPDEVAQVFEMVLRNGYLTGSVIHADGGQRLV